MRYLAWLVKIALFLLLFAFTIKNTGHVVLYGLLDSHWDAPLIIFLLIFMLAGVVFGILAMLPSLLRARSELATVKRQLKQQVDRPTIISPDLIEPAAPLDAVI